MPQAEAKIPAEVLQEINRIMLSQLEGQPEELQKALEFYQAEAACCLNKN